MLRRIIRIAAAAGVLFLLGGCVRIDDRTPEKTPDGAIIFDAWSLLLNDDASKSVEPKDNIGENDEFFVYGAKTIDGNQVDVFDGTLVRFVSSLWNYDNIRFWDPQASRYDFLAIAGPRSTAGISCNPANSGLVSARVVYNAVLAECDLKAACSQRISDDEGRWTDERRQQVSLTDPVDVEFHPLLSPVSVSVTNRSNDEITLQSWRFQNIAVGGEVSVVQDPSGVPGFSWNHTAYSYSTPVLGVSFIEPVALPPDSSYPGLWADMMIPQELTGIAYEPQIILSYAFREGNDTRSRILTIPLSQVRAIGSDAPMTVWEPGIWYEYVITILSGGAVSVIVATTNE